MIKEVYIHVGPPKTGTSAVQKWLSSNCHVLKNNSIYYPAHSVDSNGVSSGNVRAIYDVNSNKQLSLNLDRLAALMENFKQSDYSILLLSSEFFFKKMSELKVYIPEAKFIAYVRNPMEIKESSYNQSVKRHFQIEKINAGRSKRLPYMDRFVDFIDQFSESDLFLRAYGNKYFVNGNIVSDLLSVLCVNVNITLPKVNSSYQFEALEFKRWFNQFELHDFQVIVDRALQGYQDGTSDYSLIPSQQFIDDSIYYSSIIESYAQKLGASCILPLVSDMREAKPKSFYQQALNECQFLSVGQYLQKQLKMDFYLLTQEIERVKASDNMHFKEIFINSCDAKYKYLYRALKLRIKTKNALRGLKKLITFKK